MSLAFFFFFPSPKCNGVLASWSETLAAAPARSSSLAHSGDPASQAKCNGVRYAVWTRGKRGGWEKGCGGVRGNAGRHADHTDRRARTGRGVGNSATVQKLERLNKLPPDTRYVARVPKYAGGGGGGTPGSEAPSHFFALATPSHTKLRMNIRDDLDLV